MCGRAARQHAREQIVGLSRQAWALVRVLWAQGDAATAVDARVAFDALADGGMKACRRTYRRPPSRSSAPAYGQGGHVRAPDAVELGIRWT